MTDYARETMSAQARPNLSGVMAGVMARPVGDPERDLRRIITRINEAIGSVSLCADRVHQIADRVKGSIPEDENAAGLSSGGMGDISEIHSLLDALQNLINRTGDGIGRLERL